MRSLLDRAIQLATVFALAVAPHAVHGQDKTATPQPAKATGTPAGLLVSMFGMSVRDAVNAPTTGKKAYTAKMLMPWQLKQCILDAYKIDNMNLEIGRDVAPIEKDRAELARVEPLLRGKPATDKGVIDHHANIKAFNERLDSIKTKVTAEKTLHDRFHINCDGKGYFPSDVKAVLSELPPAVINAAMLRK